MNLSEGKAADRPGAPGEVRDEPAVQPGEGRGGAGKHRADGGGSETEAEDGRDDGSGERVREHRDDGDGAEVQP